MTKKIGLLFSLTGTTSLVERGQYQAALLAIEEVNMGNKSGFLPLVEDIQSDPQMAAEKARKLLERDKVDVLVGCYTSTCRKAVLPVLEDTGGLLLYPALYEGMECHPQIFYCGAVPNQQVEWVLSWAVENLSDSFILIGSDYIYPRSTNQQVKKWLERARGKIIFEKYLPLGCTQFSNLLEELQRLIPPKSPIAIFLTLVGTSVPAFYQQYKYSGLSSPIISPITSEREITIMGMEAAKGHYCVTSYFQTLNTEKNVEFVKRYQRRFGKEYISGVMEASYIAVHFLAKAYSNIVSVNSSDSNKEKFRQALRNLSLDAPQGKVIMDAENQHLWLWCRIGQVNSDGEINVVWTSPGPIPPKPYGEKVLLGAQSFNVSSKDGSRENGFTVIIGQEKILLEKVQLAKIASKTSSNVLLTGESGTGKELFARAIHEESPRRKHNFVAINCAALPRDLIASELFGYEEGAFTGAKKGGKPGKFELADGGTLFLDEIGEMPLDLQPHLLRVLEEKEIYRIGGTKPIKIDVKAG